MQGEDYTIRPYREGDEDQIVDLLQLVFGEFPKFRINCSKRDHWKWKFKDIPTGLNPTLVAINPNGKIIGVSHSLIKWTKIGDQEVLARKGAEAAVHPDYRQMGIYSSLVKERRKKNRELGVVLSYGLISNPVLIDLKKRQTGEMREPEFPQPLRQLVRIKNIPRFLDHHKEGDGEFLYRVISYTGIRLLKAINKIQRLLNPGEKPTPVCTLRKIKRFDERLDKFWNDLKDEYDFIVVKSEEYLNWRYCDLRGGEYQIWTAEKEEKVVGYMVLRIDDRELDHLVGYIMEVLAPREHGDIVDYFIGQANKYFDREEVNAAYFTVVSGHPYENIIKKHGYVDSRRSPHVFYFPYKQFDSLEKFEIAPSRRLHHQFGEYDSI